MTNSNGQGGSALPLDHLKQAARVAAKAMMERCDPASGTRIGLQIVRHAIMPAGSVVAGFYPMNREPDLRPLLTMLRRAGHTVALPKTPALGSPLSFHRFASEDGLRQERFGTWTSDGPAVDPTIILVPLLAFDRRGHRLGYGGGYYDRTIAARPGIPTIGCAYGTLELPEIPAGRYDMPLDAIATETEFIIVKASIMKAGPCASCS